MPSKFTLMIVCFVACLSACDEPHRAVETTSDRGVNLTSPGTLTPKYPVEISGWDSTVSSRNIIVDGSFESGQGKLEKPWRATSDSADIRIEAQNAADGALCLRAQTPFSVFQTLFLPAPAEYVVRLLYRMEDSDSSLKIRIDGNLDEANHFWAESKPLVGSAKAWRVGSFKFYIPAYILVSRIQFSSVSKDTVVYIDKIELRRTDALDKNLVRNPSFEDPLLRSDWYITPHIWRKRAYPGVSTKDSYCMEISPQPSADCLVSQLIKGLIPGARYRARGYIKARNLSGTVFLRVRNTPQIADASFAPISDSVSGTTDWRLLEYEFVLPSTLNFLYFDVHRSAPTEKSDTAGLFWIDRLELIEMETENERN